MSWLRLLTAVVLAVLPLVACTPPDPKQELQVSELEGYWVVDTSKGGVQRISPALRFKVTNKAAQRPIQATATFKRKENEDVEWGSAFEQVAQAGRPIPIGQSRVVVLIADSHYTAPGEPADMFGHAQFKDAKVELFFRLGSSPWTKMATVDIERRLGTRALENAPAARP